MISQEFAPLELNEVFLEQVKADPESANKKCPQQSKLINMVQRGRRIFELTGNKQDITVRLGEQAESILIDRTAGLVYDVLKKRRIHIDSENYEDARQVALFGLVKAIRTYKEENKGGASFGTYAFKVMENEIGTRTGEVFGMQRKQRIDMAKVFGFIEQYGGTGLNFTPDSISAETGVDKDIVLSVLNMQPVYIDNSINSEDPNTNSWNEIIPDKMVMSESDIVLNLDVQRILDPQNKILKPKEVKLIDLLLEDCHTQEEIAVELGLKTQGGVSRLIDRVHQKVVTALAEKPNLLKVRQPTNARRENKF